MKIINVFIGSQTDANVFLLEHFCDNTFSMNMFTDLDEKGVINILSKSKEIGMQDACLLIGELTDSLLDAFVKYSSQINIILLDSKEFTLNGKEAVTFNINREKFSIYKTTETVNFNNYITESNHLINRIFD